MEFLSSVIKVVACTKAVKYSINICKCKDISNLVPCVSLFPHSPCICLSNELCSWKFCPLPVPLCCVSSIFVLVKLQEQCRLPHKAFKFLKCCILKVYWLVGFGLFLLHLVAELWELMDWAACKQYAHCYFVCQPNLPAGWEPGTFFREVYITTWNCFLILAVWK